MDIIQQNTTQGPIITQAWRVKDINKLITDYIVQELEQGRIPWQQPAALVDNQFLEMPMNPVTNKYYQKINVILLWCSANRNYYSSNEWAGLKQWNTLYENVRRDEKGTMITYYDSIQKEVNGQILKTPFLNHTYVFNRCQLASFKKDVVVKPKNDKCFIDKITMLDDFIANTNAVVEQHHGPARYNRVSDKILLPYSELLQADVNLEKFYTPLLTKLIHWTGASNRLNRYVGKEVGDHAFVAEELTAEFGAAFLLSQFGITKRGANNNVNIASWLNVFKDNKHCLLTAASEATKAVNYLTRNNQP